MAFLIRSNLRQLVVSLALLGTLVAVFNMFITSAKIQKQALIENTLQSNEAYASKLADSTQLFLENTQLELAYSASEIAKHWPDHSYFEEEVSRLSEKNRVFNSVIFTNKSGMVLSSSDRASELRGQVLRTSGNIQALTERRPLMSQPYKSQIGNLLVLISHPVYHNDGRYLGYIGGTIYLEENNILNRLLDEHYYKDGSYIYVADSHRRLLYHPDKSRLGTTVEVNAAISLALSGATGSLPIVNSKNIEMLSGYAYIPAAQWAVVSQRPTESTLQAHEGLMRKIFLHSLPFNLGILALIWFCGWLIANPLRQLARNAKNMKQRSTIQRIERIPTWYFEANELKKAFLYGLQNIHDHVGQLRQDVRTDPLTGLHNRRSLEHVLEKCERSNTPFSIISLDIDHFKHINDTYGHDIGDEVLKELALIMQHSSREQDLSIRMGGEEFLVFLPDCSLIIASEIAERLRINVENHPFEQVEHITISLGVAAWPMHHHDTAFVLKLADNMLYAAKQGGRNQVRTAPASELTNSDA